MQQTKKNQDGIVSIVITIILMMVLSLIVLGFSKVTRREQRQSLDRQLASQAYYAAESGVNDARNYLLKVNPSYNSNSCGQFTTDSGISNVVNAAVQTSYTCVLVNPAPKSLEASGLSPGGSSWATPVRSLSGLALSEMTIGWNNPAASERTYSVATCPAMAASPALPPQANWQCGAGILRVDIVPMDTITRAALLSASRTILLYPVSSGGPTSIVYGSLQKGLPVSVGCVVPALPTSTVPDCKFTIQGLTLPSYYVRIKPLYAAANVVVTAKIGASDARLAGAQAVVDVTGKANDVLKRIQARISLATPNNFDYALQSVDSVCKVYNVIPSIPAEVTIEDTIANASDDSACALP